MPPGLVHGVPFPGVLSNGACSWSSVCGHLRPPVKGFLQRGSVCFCPGQGAAFRDMGTTSVASVSWTSQDMGHEQPSGQKAGSRQTALTPWAERHLALLRSPQPQDGAPVTPPPCRAGSRLWCLSLHPETWLNPCLLAEQGGCFPIPGFLVAASWWVCPARGHPCPNRWSHLSKGWEQNSLPQVQGSWSALWSTLLLSHPQTWKKWDPTSQAIPVSPWEVWTLAASSPAQPLCHAA